MNIKIAIISFTLGCSVCWPLFRYFFRVVSSNEKEYRKGFRQIHNQEPEEAMLSGRGLKDDNVEYFVYASVAVFLIPCIPASFLAVGFYFLISWAVR